MAAPTTHCPNCGARLDDASSCHLCGGTPSATPDQVGSSLRCERGEAMISAIIAANVLFYLLSLMLSRDRGLGGSLLGFLSPDQTSLLVLGATGTVPVLELGRYWTLISANYLHGGLLHIIFNMVALRQIGPWVSMEYGASRMFTIYTLSGVAGYLVSCAAGVAFTIGASASVCGLIGALYYFGKSRGGSYGTAVSREVSGWLISLVLFGLVMPGINNWGHGGGIVGGALVAMVLGYSERRPEGGGQRMLATFCWLLTLLVLLYAGGSSLLIWFG